MLGLQRAETPLTRACKRTGCMHTQPSRTAAHSASQQRWGQTHEQMSVDISRVYAAVSLQYTALARGSS